MQETKKRLFFGMELAAPWPADLPVGRVIPPEARHLTLAFLGHHSFEELHRLLAEFPTPTFHVGLSGFFDQCLFFPPKHSHVAAWHVQLYDPKPLLTFQASLAHWLSAHAYPVEEREWIPHATLCRKPFDPHAWKKSFTPLPLYCSSVHLYESKGHSNYTPLWSCSIIPPFQEIEHLADLAFLIHGETLLHLYYNAFTALAFKYPILLSYFQQVDTLDTLDDLIILLNQIVSAVDSRIGSPFKAVSFHGGAKTHPDHPTSMQWEMIVDV